MKCNDAAYKTADMQILIHHVYEYKKGIRNLILHTMPLELLEYAIERLNRDKINYYVQHVSNQKINLFFGREECVKIVQLFGVDRLNELTKEQDFMLGIMLGYDRMQQCERFLGVIKLKPEMRQNESLKSSAL